MFKKTKKTEEEQSETFKQPKIKQSREIRTHLRERTAVEKIFFLFTDPHRRAATFKMILSLPQAEFERNIYMLADQTMNTLIKDKKIERDFYTVLKRLLSSERSSCLNSLCAKYLQAQLTSDPQYVTFLDFLIRHFKCSIVQDKERIASCIVNSEIRDRILALTQNHRPVQIDYKTPFYFIRKQD